MHPTHQGALQWYQECGKRCHVLGRSQCNKQTKRNKQHIEMKLHLHLRMVVVVLVCLEKLEEFPSLQQMDMGLKLGDQDIQIL